MVESTRSNAWLTERLSILRKQFFRDVEVENQLIVRFGRRCRSRFGSITVKKLPNEPLSASVITINGLFIHEEVPEYVIDATLIHEFIHYTHGFHSPRRQIYQHPHRGNIIRKEFVARGAEKLEDLQNIWVKEHYKDFLLRHLPPAKRGVKRVRRRIWR